MKKLYFIALIPPKELEKEIKALKEEIKTRYGSKHALKLPAHITLQMPFKSSEEEEPLLIKTLRTFTAEQEQFNIDLDGFGCFPPRVIYINVENPAPVKQIQEKLQPILEKRMKLKENEKMTRFHPHITIASRDLNKEAFHKVWPDFQYREFKASFLATNLFLLKHNGKTWDIFECFTFQDS